MWRDKKNEPGGYKDDRYWDAMVRHTDKMVGKVLDHLDQSGLADNTLVIWTGDNGTYKSVTSKWKGRDYVGGKGRNDRQWDACRFYCPMAWSDQTGHGL